LISLAVISLFSLLFIGRYFGALSSSKAAIILLAPLLCWFTEMRSMSHWSITRVAIVRAILVISVLTVVLFVARQEFNRRMKPLLSTIAIEGTLKSFR
jgi:hypothetical protein